MPDPATEVLGKAVRQNSVYLAVGVIERDTQFSGGTLYCTLLYFGPNGQLLAGPLYNEEGILYADLDLAEVARSKFDFDVVGHYARPDVFQLLVNESPMLPVVNSYNTNSTLP